MAPTLIFLPGKSHGQRSLAGYSPQGPKESDTTERFHFTSLPLFPMRPPADTVGFPQTGFPKPGSCPTLAEAGGHQAELLCAVLGLRSTLPTSCLRPGSQLRPAAPRTAAAHSPSTPFHVFSGSCHLTRERSAHPLFLPAVQEPRVPSLGREDPLEEDMATHSRVLAWRIPWL